MIKVIGKISLIFLLCAALGYIVAVQLMHWGITIEAGYFWLRYIIIVAVVTIPLVVFSLVTFKRYQRERLTTPKGVAGYMRGATSKDDWMIRAGHVQDANGGEYPEFWHATIIASGILGTTSSRWPGKPVA